MKKTDIAMIILIATVGVLVSFFTVRAILGDVSSDPQKVQKIEKIQVQELEPDTRIFNSNAINPSVEVEIEGSADAAPVEDTKTEE